MLLFLASMVEISVDRCSEDGLFTAYMLLNMVGKFQSNGKFCPNQEMKLCFRAGGDRLVRRYCESTGLDFDDFGQEVSFMDAFRAVSQPISQHIGHYQNWACFHRGKSIYYFFPALLIYIFLDCFPVGSFLYIVGIPKLARMALTHDRLSEEINLRSD